MRAESEPRVNLFIVGAPKCGTTSLGEWLGQHPEIFMSTPKEPCFFYTDIGPLKTKNMKEYLSLFPFENNYKYYGEATTYYLQSDAAPECIHEYNNNSKIIVMLRDPLDLVVSLHSEEVKSFHENETEFEKAWLLQEKRELGDRIPNDCPDNRILLYKKRAFLGCFLERYYNVFDKKYFCIFLDDLAEEPLAVYLSVLGFLDLNDDGFRAFHNHNKRSVYK